MLGVKALTNVFSQNVNIEEWRIRRNKVGAQRLSSLHQALPYSSIAQRVADEIKNVQFYPKRGDREAKNNKRAEFYFSVDPETLDIFFNSSQGYRAQYYLDSQRGIESNRIVIDLLKDKLIEAASQSNQTMMSIEQVKKSLEHESVKIWINEKHSTLNQTSRDPEQIMVLEIPRWMETMEQVLSAWAENQQPNPSIKTRALLGVQAPEGNCMEVLGAWLDDKDKEFVVPSKIKRAQHIHEYGFS